MFRTGCYTRFQAAGKVCCCNFWFSGPPSSTLFPQAGGSGHLLLISFVVSRCLRGCGPDGGQKVGGEPAGGPQSGPLFSTRMAEVTRW